MKKLTIFVTAALLSMSFNSMAFTLAGTPLVLDQDAFRYCAGAKNINVCMERYLLIHKSDKK
ncbi:hypothetical protein [Photobacterium lipolyticum]|uniref:DUF1496 domain-containing protein n=1 Tax=Photobacterium lipolyticum TaxID=266810 RepID=A0A2T3N590_9GAMM|nr:hypothetical protein [Photobacterium lipolyticum]PSW07626.1 hypothetical protein C9I89_02660 [Photobacterium lipolyticum]